MAHSHPEIHEMGQPHLLTGQIGNLDYLGGSGFNQYGLTSNSHVEAWNAPESVFLTDLTPPSHFRAVLL